MGLFTYIKGQNYSKTVTINENINIAKYVIDGVPPGQVLNANPGIIAERPPGGSQHGIMVVIDNTDGTAEAFLARAAEIAAYDPTNDAVISWGPLRVAGGQSDTFGPFDWNRFNLILRQLVGAQCRVAVLYNGEGVDLS